MLQRVLYVKSPFMAFHGISWLFMALFHCMAVDAVWRHSQARDYSQDYEKIVICGIG